MYVLSYTVDVNPDGAEPRLSREQIWRGLEMKAENALPFVPGMSKCELLERTGTTILRDVTFAGTSHREKITLYPPVQVHFQRLGENGFITNTVTDSDRGLLLNFTFALDFPGTEPDSPEEKAKGDEMRHAYVGAVAATLKRVREMVRAGEI